jgi:predicted ATPase
MGGGVADSEESPSAASAVEVRPSDRGPGSPLLFISYASEDAAVAVELRDLLLDSGYRTWIAPDDIRGARSWAEQILEAISDSNLLLVVISTRSMVSSHVSREVNLALDKGKAVLPIRIEECLLSGTLKYLLALVQWVDAFPAPLDLHWEQLSQRISDVLTQPATTPHLYHSLPGGALSRRRTNLPAQVTTFVGRRAELAELESLVRDRRLVTVTGVGGVGKTRLALQVAADLVGDMADGVWLLELASLDDPALISGSFLEAMEVNRSGEVTATEFLLEVLADRQSLLLVDNCEHLIDAAADLIESILKRAPAVKVLATSRQPLTIPGEYRFSLSPMSLRPGADRAGSRLLHDDDALDLFMERARAVFPLSFDEASGPLVSDICRRLDGLPLALELAAAQLDHLTLEDLAAALDSELSVESPYRSTPSRQRTLESTVDWSCRLLTPPEQSLFRQLAVFTGDFDREAVDAVCAFGHVSGQGAPLLDRLVKRSLISRLPNGRYQLLQVLRHAATEQLRQAEELGGSIASHARYYLKEAALALSRTRSAKAVEWMRRIELDWPNTRAALQWGLENDFHQGVQAVIGLSDYFAVMRGWEGIEWTGRFLVTADEVERIELHRTRARAGLWPAVHSVVTESANHVLDHRVGLNDEVVIEALSALAFVGLENWDSNAVKDYAALIEKVPADSPRILRLVAGVNAYRCAIAGNMEGAEEWFRKSLELVPLTGELWSYIGSGSNLAETVMLRGRLDESLTIINEAVRIGRDLEFHFHLSFALITRAEVLHRLARPVEALESALEGFELAHRNSNRFEFVLGAETIAAILLSLGLTEDAAAVHALGHHRAQEWDHEGVLAQYRRFHDEITAGLGSFSQERAAQEAQRALNTPVPLLIEQIRIGSSPSTQGL